MGYTLLMWAAECGHTEVVRLLLKNNAQVDLQDRVSDREENVIF